jgi:hypothetical protein
MALADPVHLKKDEQVVLKVQLYIVDDHQWL